MKATSFLVLVAACAATAVGAAASPLAAYFKDLPAGTDPGTISRRITDQFLTSRPENYRPAGYHGNEGYGWNKSVQYSVVSLWVNALACARLDGDTARAAKLIKLFDDFLPGRPKNRCCSRPYHVDDTIFGALPYEIYLANKDPRCLEMGNFYADTQWTPPCEGTIKERHAAPKEVQEGFWAKGYTPQTRLWIDDMYMITVLQSQAFRATGDRKYIDRTAKEMCLYLDELQLKEGPAKGLFYHAPDVKYVWGRGDGWMAAGMALVLDRLPADSEYRARILEGYHAMMETLLRFQRADGLWGQLIDRPDDPRNWGETSCTAMFTYAFATGVARGWLDAGRYGPAARKAWLALCGKLDAFANIADVCVGTGKKDDLQYYFDRPHVNGDPHGQAPMLWISSVLLETGAGRLTGLRTPATSKHFEKRIDPETGVVSYALSGGVDENRQSLYFTAKSMTDDGRFLVFDVSPNERRVREARAEKKGTNPLAKRSISKHKAFIDFATDSYIDLPNVNGQIPFVDVKGDYMVYCRDQVFYRLDFKNPSVETKLCAFPSELLKDGARLRYPFTHLTLTRDRRKAFLDSCVISADNATTNYVQGLLELATGKYESWGKTEFFANHGQINPARDDLAMCAWECCWTTGGTEYKKKTGWYPRMWHAFPDGRRVMHPAKDKNYASHEYWDEDGEGFYWCGGGVWHEDLASGKQECLCPIPGAHATMTLNEKYVVFDESVDGWWRGCKWRVGFWNRETKRCVYAYSTRPELARKSCESKLHPDPHPHFACNEKYVVSTANNARGNMELYVTPVDQLIARTTMSAPTGGKTVRVENPLDVARPAETVSVKWEDLGLKPGDTAVRVWDVAACAPVAFQDDRRRKTLLFSTALGPKETKEFRILADASLPQADLSIVCWSQYLPERMDDFAWENDRFGARAYGPAIMEPAPKGQKLVSSGVDIINKCVKYPVLHRWFVERTGEGSYHKDHGEGMDNYKVGPSRGCGGLGACGADGWKYSINWSRAKMIQCGPVRTEFELVYPAWGGFGEETRRVTLDRGQFFAHAVSTFKGKTPAGMRVGPGLDCAKERQHNGTIARDLAQGWIANWEPADTDGPDTGTIATAILLAPAGCGATTGTDALGCEYLFPASASKGVDYWSGAVWSGSKAVKNAKGWQACVRDFAAGLRAPVKVTVEPGATAAVPKVIFDTDMYTDFDDVGAMAVLHALADAGECEILGTVVSTRKAPSTAMVELINRFYGRGSLPIGAPRGLGVGTDNNPGAMKNGSYKIYASMAAAHPELKVRTGDDAPDANDVYRKLLSAAPDGSVTIVTVGFTTNMRRLLETKADAVSPLDGRALVAKKVKAWYAMACRYPDGREYNSGEDGASSKIAFAAWPTPIYFLDYCYGVEVKCGVPASKLGDPANPVCEVFTRALKDYREEGRGHPSWDEITVLAAVRGWERYFGVERGTFAIVDEKGRNHWTKDPNGNHYVLTVKTPKAEVGRIVDELIVRPPKHRPADAATARIDEIAASLPERPAADGARITDRAKWEKLAALPEAKREIAEAEKLLGEGVPDAPDNLYLEFTQNGNRRHYEIALAKRMRGLTHLYLAECLENRGRFLPKIVEYLDSFCAMKSWTLPAHDGNLTCFKGDPHVDLMCGHIALMLAFCCDWLGDRLPAATQAKVRAEVERRALRPHLDHARGVRKVYGHWWFHGGNNWNSVCNACMVRTALALVADRRLRAEYVAIAEATVPYALKGYTDDGYCSEGMGYWNYGYGHHLEMGLSLRAATGGKVNLFADPKCREVMKYAYGFQVQDGRSPHFADGGGNAGADNLALGRQIWPDLANDAALNCSLFAGGVPTLALRAFGQEPARTEPTMNVLPLRSWFPDAQVLISRVHHPDRTMHLGIAFKGGHNDELHNHNDVGSYYIMLDGTEMGGDPGGETYTRRTFSRERYVSKVLNSYGHPVPVVGGELQKTGRAAAGRVLRTAFTDAKDEIEIEYASAYPVKTLKSLVRTMTFDRVADRITVTDRIVCTAPTAFEVPVITYRTWKQNAEATEFLFDKGAKSYRKLKMNVTASAPVTFAKTLIENPDHPDVQRLAFTFAAPVTEATFTTVYSSR